MTLIYGTAVNTVGQHARGKRVVATLNRGAVDTNDRFIAVSASTLTNLFGYWQLDLVPNSELATPNTYYIIRVNGQKFYVDVPVSASPVAAASLLIPVPSNPILNNTYVYSIAGLAGAITAEDIQAIAGSGEGGGGAVSSVDGRIGDVSLGDRYATLAHTHLGQYAPVAHTHPEYAAEGHNHDERYVQLDGERVRSVNGLTGDIDLDSYYAPLGHSHGGEGGGGGVSSVEGRTGDVVLNDMFADIGHLHTGVYSPVAHTHSTYSLTSHNHHGTYVQIGQETVTSVNGQTGDVVVSGGGGGGAVDSVDGRTGVVELDDLYASTSHTHEGVYVEVGEETITSVDGQTGAVDLSAVYAASGHNHSGVYSPVAHTHTGVYVEVGSETVTSVDGQTGDVDLSTEYAAHDHNHTGVYSPVGHNHDSAYAAASHNHDGVYSLTSHNHDSAYSAVGHSHTYPVTSVDSRTGAVTLNDLYAAVGHNHNSAYAALSHNHDSAYSAIGHNHNGVYSLTSHDHAGVYATAAHNHDATYATIGHTHSQFTAGTWTNVPMAASPVAGQIQYRSEPCYGIVRLKTTARVWGSGVAAGSTLGTLPVGFRPATEFKCWASQGAEPTTQTAVAIKITTAGVISVQGASLNGTAQANGLVIDTTFSTT